MKILALAAILAIQGCAAWAHLSQAEKLAAVVASATAAQSATGTAVNVKALIEK